MHKRFILIIAPFLLLFAFACGRVDDSTGAGDSALAQCRYVDVSSLKDRVYLSVPYTEQEPNYCGPASLEMLLSYYGHPVDQDVLGKDIVGPTGVSSGELRAKAIENGFSVSFSYCGLNALLENLSNGSPAIVRVLNNMGNNGHFFVVTGYDMAEKTLYINDPSDPQNTEVSFDTFDRIWNITTLGPENNSSRFMMLIDPICF